jgi:hypothetical protein
MDRGDTDDLDVAVGLVLNVPFFRLLYYHRDSKAMQSAGAPVFLTAGIQFVPLG